MNNVIEVNTKQSNILLLTSRSDLGGGTKHVYELAKSLISKHKYNVHIATPSAPPFGQKFRELTSNIIEIPHRKLSLFYLYRLIRYILSNNIYIVHSHGRGAGVYAKLLSIILKNKIVAIHTFHGVHSPKSSIGKMITLLERLTSIFTQQFICVSSDEYLCAMDLKLSKKNNTVIIQNGVDFSLLDRNAHPLKLSGRYKVGTLARLCQVKRIDLLIELAKNFQIKYPELKFYVAGTGELESELKELNKKQGSPVTFLGEVYPPDNFLSSLDAYISTSDREGLPLSVIEALYFNIPIFLSDVPGHKTFIKNNYAYKIESLNTNTINQKKLHDTKRFSIETMTNKVSSIYDRYLMK